MTDDAREAAKALGHKRYLGAACPKDGHDGERYTSNGMCIACGIEYNAARGKAKPLSEGRSKPMAQRVASRKSIPIPKLKEAAVTPLLMPLIELKSNQCRWPYDTERGVLFCGLDKVPSTPDCPAPPYCGPHKQLAHVPWRSVPRSLTVPSSLAA
jgi:GcrA cell cycle regulator